MHYRVPWEIKVSMCSAETHPRPPNPSQTHPAASWNREDTSSPFAFFTDISGRIFVWGAGAGALLVGALRALRALGFGRGRLGPAAAAAAGRAGGSAVPPFPATGSHAHGRENTQSEHLLLSAGICFSQCHVSYFLVIKYCRFFIIKTKKV